VQTARDEEKFRAGASFRVQGLSMDFDGISRELGLAPAGTHKQGESGPLVRSYPSDMWYLDSPLGKNNELELHLIWLAERLLPRKQEIFRLREKYKVDIYCYKTCYTEQASLTLSSSALRIFTELDTELGVSLIFLPDENEQVSASGSLIE
jgi:hypothetical protein